MGEKLWMKFLEEEINDLQIVILSIGINGLLGWFEGWLKENNYLKDYSHPGSVKGEII